jgi:solute:Na+ symporter, SSS family
MVFALDTAKDSFDLLLQVGAGTGLLYLVRWFWWRVTAWCEIVAMISSFGVSIVFLVLKKNGMVFDTSKQLLLTIACTTACWLLTAFLGPANDPAVLMEFYKKVRPFGPGWRHVRLQLGISDADAKADIRVQNIPQALVGWIMGCTMIWSALFTVGNFLYGRTGYALALFGVFLVSGGIVVRIVKRIWD